MSNGIEFHVGLVAAECLEERGPRQFGVEQYVAKNLEMQVVYKL